MDAISYCKKYTIGHNRLEILLNKVITSDYILTEEELMVYPNSVNPSKKGKSKLNAKANKRKKIKKSPGKANPWNRDNLKVRAWIVKK